MTIPAQAGRPMRLFVPSQKEDRLLLVGFDGSETISQLYRFTLDVRVPLSEAIEFDELLGKELRVDAFDAAGHLVRQLHGIASEVGETGRDSAFIHLQLEMSPKLWLLTQTLRSRIFQELTVVEIVDKILGEHNVARQFRLVESYPVRHYTTQYQESDFEFISRLLEDHGIYFSFEHDAKGHRVVFADQSLAAATIPTALPLEYRVGEGGIDEKFHVHEWRPKVRLRPGKYLTRDHSFHLPNKSHETRDSLRANVAFGVKNRRLVNSANEGLVQYEYPGDYAKLFDAAAGGESLENRIASERERTIRIRAQEQACRGIEIEGRSNCPALTPGCQFVFANHGNSDGAYFITGVYHFLRMPEYRVDVSEPATYECGFECLPAGLPFRPRRDTSRPAIYGTQTATVVGSGVNEGDVAVDEFGRVKVHFHWDLEGTRDGKDSCWIRVASPWAGQGWGMVSYPRVGQEVVVDFQDGDPDRPLIIGSVYNAEQTNPHSVPDRRNEMCIKSRTVGGEAGDFHGLSLDDSQGAELFRLRSQKDMLVEVKNNHQLAIPNAQTTVTGLTAYVQTGALISTQPSSETESESEGSESESGSGEESGGEAETEESSDWQGVTVESGLAYKVETTFGGYCDYVMGYGTHQYVGIFHEVCVCPAGFLGAIPIVGSALGGMLGKADVSHGGETVLVYGPQFEAAHGSKKERAGEFKETKAIIKVMATLHGFCTIANVLMPGLVDSWDVVPWKDACLVTEAVETAALGLLILVEDLTGEVVDLETEVERLNQEIAAVKFTADSAVDLAIAKAEAIMTWGENCLQWTAGNNVDDRKISVAGSMENVVQGVYSVDANDGVRINSQDAIALTSSDGCAIVTQSGVGSSGFAASPLMGVAIRNATTALVDNSLLMNLEGVQMSSSFLDGVVESSMAMTAAGITLKGATIKLQDLTGMNSIEISSTGITLSGIAFTGNMMARNELAAPVHALMPA